MRIPPETVLSENSVRDSPAPSEITHTSGGPGGARRRGRHGRDRGRGGRARGRGREGGRGRGGAGGARGAPPQERRHGCERHGPDGRGDSHRSLLPPVEPPPSPLPLL